MAAGDDIDLRRKRGEAAFHEALALKHDDRAAMARRIGAVEDAVDAEDQAVEARAAAERARTR